MGLLGKLAGTDKMAEVCSRKLAQIESQFESGRAEASVLLTQEEIGARFDLDNFSSFLCREFEKAGYQVIGVTDPGWTYKMTITVIESRLRSRRELPYRNIRPAEVERPGGGHVTVEVAAFRAVRPFGEAELVNVPFGRGFGLEEAVALVKPIFAREDPKRIWFYAGGVVNALTRDIAAKRVSLEDWDDVLGHHEPIFETFGLSRRQLQQAISDLGEIKKLLAPLRQEEGRQYEIWRSNAEWALETWVWATILDRRLGQVGKTVLIEL